MPHCLLRLVVYATLPDERDIELACLIELPSSPSIGTDLQAVACSDRNTPPLTVRRVLGGSTDKRLIIDLDDVRGDFEQLVAQLVSDGWLPRLEFSFDDEHEARAFAEEHGDTLIRMFGKYYLVDSVALWCLDKSGARYERVPLRYDQN